MPRVRLVIADRRPIVLQGFETLFAAERDFEIVASCTNGAGCLEAVRRLAPDVALVEDGFPDLTAVEMLAAVNVEKLPTRLVFYTASVARGDLATAIAAGDCTAIPMREEPETLLQSLRLVAPAAGLEAIRRAGNGASGDNGLAALTDQERKIMRLVASGMSNRDIARQLKVAPGTVEARIDRISAQFELRNRPELAAFVLSRLYGGVGALTALIWAVLNDLRPASAATIDHAHSDGVTVMAADGAGSVVTIKIVSQKAAAAPDKTAAPVRKAGRAENSGPDMSTRGSKPIESRADIVAGTTILPPLNPPRPGLSSYGTAMMMAVGVSAYELLNSPAQAFTGSDNWSDYFAWGAANAGELAAPDVGGAAGAQLTGLDNPAWLHPETRQETFAFEAVRGDVIGESDEPQLIDAAASWDGVSARGNPHVGSGTIDAPVDHGGSEQAAATDAPGNSEHSQKQGAASDGSKQGQSQRDSHVAEDGVPADKQKVKHDTPEHETNHGQSQRDLHASEEGVAAGKQKAKHDTPEHETNHGQSQRDLHASEEGAAPGKQKAKHDSPEHESSHGRSQRDLHASEEGVAAGKQKAKHDTPEHETNHGQSQRDLHASEEGAAPGKQKAKHDSPEHESSHGRSQRDLHASEEGVAAAKLKAKHDSPEHESNHGQSQRDSHAPKDGSATAERSDKNDAPGAHANSGQSQRDLHEAHANASKNPHAGPGQKAGASDQTSGDAGPTQTTAASASGDSFHFKNDTAENKNSYHWEVGRGRDTAEHGLHHAGNDDAALMQVADLNGPPHAEPSAVNHIRGPEHHPTHDWFV